jgi:arylsulfatase A-like enzyme
MFILLRYSNHIVGKWHLGHYKLVYTPLHRGFDSHTGYWTGHQDYYVRIFVDKTASHYIFVVSFQGPHSSGTSILWLGHAKEF